MQCSDAVLQLIYTSTALTESAVILREIRELRKKLEQMEKLLRRDNEED